MAFYWNTREDSASGRPPKPTAQDVIQIKEYMMRYYSALKIQQEVDHAYYQLKVKISTPTGYDAVLPPTARSLVNDASDHIASAQPRFTVPRARQTEKAEREAEKIDKWLEAAWNRLNENEPTPIHRQAAVSALSKGMIALHIRFLPNRIPKKPEDESDTEAQDEYDAKRRLAFPFQLSSHDPRWVFPDPATNGQNFVIERFYKTVGAVQQQHPEWGGWRNSSGEPRDPNDPVEWIYYCDRYWRCYLADSQFVSYVRGVRPGPVPHGYGFVPWAIRSAGLSDESGLPDEKFQSMLYIVRGLLDEELRVWSQGQAILKDFAYPWTIVPIGAKVDPGARKISEVPMDMIDKIKQLRPDAQSPKAVLDWIEQVSAGIERATYSQVVTGRAPTGQRSGYSIAVLAGMARVKFGPMLTNIESAHAEIMRKLLWMIENKVGDTVPVWMGGRTDFEIGPKDIKGYERIDCEIKAKLVQDEAADADIGLRLYQTGTLSAETMLQKYAHLDNPLEEIDRRIAEEFLKHPAVMATMMLEIAKRRGIDPSLLQMFMQANGLGGGQSQMPGQSSPGGTPPGGPPGMAGSVAPGAPGGNPQGRPSVPLSGPTSPLGMGGAGPAALNEVAALPGAFRRAGQLGGGDLPLG